MTDSIKIENIIIEWGIGGKSASDHVALFSKMGLVSGLRDVKAV